MRREIITTIEFSNGNISVCVLENLNGNVIEIHNAVGLIKKAHMFLKEHIAKIEEKIEGKLQDVTVIVDPNSKVNHEIKIVSESILIPNSEVSKQEVNSLLTQTKNRNKSKDRDVILVQPLQYEVTDALTKKYIHAPIGRKGNKLSAIIAITTISSITVDFIRSVVNAHNLKINKILLKPQALSQNNISSNTLNQGSILFDIGERYSFVTINKNGATVALKVYDDYGFNKLVEGITQRLGCSETNAKKLLSIYGSLNSVKENRVIYTYTEGIKQVTVNEIELKKVISTFINKLTAQVANYLGQKNVTHLPIVISGKLNNIANIEQYIEQNFNTSVTKYVPMTYVEINEYNQSTNGVIHFKAGLSKTLGKSILSIVETNPNKFSTISDKLNKNIKKGLWSKILYKLGGLYERN